MFVVKSIKEKKITNLVEKYNVPVPEVDLPTNEKKRGMYELSKGLLEEAGY